MGFSQKTADDALVAANRCCCICHKQCGSNIELHHIVPRSKNGDDTFDNCIPLCFDCHAEVEHYNNKHPRGRKFTSDELRKHRDQWYAQNAHSSSVPTIPPPGQLTGPYDTRLSPREKEFFGREKEIEAILKFLNSDQQCFHITGTGGTGKTELCKAALKEWLTGNNEARAFYIPLPDTVGESTLIYHVGKAMGEENISSFEELRPLLEGGLYHLDNIENIASTAEGKDALRKLKSSAGVRILATSRVSLDPILGQHVLVYRLDNDSAVQLFLSAWNGNDTLTDDKRLHTFVVNDLGGHALSIALTTRLGETYGIERIFRMWSEHGTQTIAGDEDADRIESLTRSLLFTSEALATIPGAHSIWTIAALFPEGLSADTIEQIVADYHASLRALCTHHILVRNGDVYSMLPPIARFAIDEALAKRDGFSWMETREAMYLFFFSLAEKADSIASTPEALEARRQLLAQFPALHSFVSAELKAKAKDEPRIFELHSSLRNQYMFRISLGIEIARILHKLEPENPWILNSLGDLERQTGNPDTARHYFNQSLQLYEEVQDDFGRANTLKSLGDLELQTGNLDKAREYFDQSLPLYEKEQSDLGRANTLLSFGDLELRTGNLDKAREYFDQSLPLYEKEQDNLGRANTLHSLGDLELQTGNPDKAREYFSQCLPLYEKEQSDHGRANTLHSLGDLELQTGNPDKARDYFCQCLPLYEKEQSDLGKANTLRSLGELELQIGRPDIARDYFCQCLPLYEKDQSDLGKANTIRLTGDLDRNVQNYASALRLYDEAIPLFIKVQNKDDLARNYAGMSLCYRAMGNNVEMNNTSKLAYETAIASHLHPVIEYVLSILKECGIEPPEQDS